MKCGACGQEVALAKICPYCGSKVDHQQQETGAEEQPGPKGTFRGRVEDEARSSRPGGRSLLPGFGQILRFLMDPRIVPSAKYLFFLALFYLLSPIDLLPGFAAPVLGWLDDLAVAALALRFVASQLEKVDRR
ncbi:MAG: DUF1232 domain-containing protein [Clostridia bacterium]